MQRIRFYSDDSYSHNGKPKQFHIVVAGFALSADRENIRKALAAAEQLSKKGLVDWNKSPAQMRERYIDAVLAIPGLHGRIFYLAVDSLPMPRHGEPRLQALNSAIGRFTTGDCHHQMFPEGMRQSRQRHALRKALIVCGCERVTVETAQFVMDPEVRLSDALAGYIRGELYRGDGERAKLTNLPDWFLDLGA
jgi:hypothetical protein